MQSTITQETGSMRPLTRAEIHAETAKIRAYLTGEITARWGGTMTLRIEFNGRFTRRLGDCLVVDYAKRIVRLRFSSSPLYRRASDAERVALWIHEFAHGAANLDAGKRVGHKAPWKRMMVRLGASPDRCHTVNRDGLRRRARRRVPVVLRRSSVRPTAPVAPVRVRPTLDAGAPVGFRLRGVRGRGLVVHADARTVTVRVVGDHGRAFFGAVVTVSVDCVR